jgi:hypothetical protein
MIGQNDRGRKPRVEIWWEYDEEPSSDSATGNGNISILNGYIDKGKQDSEINRKFRKHDEVLVQGDERRTIFRYEVFL